MLFFIFLAVSLSWASISIPLPSQSHYLAHGIQTGMAAGGLSQKKCQTRFSWVGSFEYAYTPQWSGGASARLFGGDIDASHSVVSTRYTVQARHHWLWSEQWDTYLQLAGTFDNSTFQALRQNFFAPEKAAILDTGYCMDALDYNGAAISLELGSGSVVVGDLGFYSALQAELNTQKKIRYTLRIGTAYELRPLWKRLQDHLQSAWISLEWSRSYAPKIQGASDMILLGFQFGM